MCEVRFLHTLSVYGKPNKSDSPLIPNPVILAGMVWSAVKHGLKQTWTKRGGSAVVGAVGVAFVGFAYWQQNGSLPADRLATAELALGGLCAGLVAALAWNLALAPYRIERDKRKALEVELGRLAPRRADGPVVPDWTIHQLFRFLNLNALAHANDSSSSDAWRRVEMQIKDKASLGLLQVWGRKFDRSGMSEFLGDRKALIAIDPDYWAEASLTFAGIFSDAEEARYNSAHTSNLEKHDQYCDLQINRAQAEALWSDAKMPDPAHFVVGLSGYGVAELMSSSITAGIDHVKWNGDTPRLEVFFSRPVTQDYTVTVEGDDQVFQTIVSKTAASMVLDLRGPSSTIFPARVTIKMLSTPLRECTNRFLQTAPSGV